MGVGSSACSWKSCHSTPCLSLPHAPRFEPNAKNELCKQTKPSRTEHKLHAMRCV